jgi:nucleotide-binding universal stress UspA family protein
LFERLLVPTDFSKYSQKVLECVSELPRAKDVVLLHVIGPADPLARVWDPGARIEEARAKLSEQKSFLESRGLKVEAKSEILMEGKISEVMEKTAEEMQTPLIVMGARGKGLVEGILLGNVAKSLLRYGSTDLLLLRYAVLEGRKGPALDKFCSQPFSKVLCPTDFSRPAAEALAFLKGTAGIREILLQHVIYRGETWKEVDASREGALRELNSTAKEIEASGPRVSVHVSVGNPVEEICEFASTEDVSLIAMSSHGKGWLEQLTVGSTTYEVAKNADRPVLVIRAARIMRAK